MSHGLWMKRSMTDPICISVGEGPHCPRARQRFVVIEQSRESKRGGSGREIAQVTYSMQGGNNMKLPGRM